MKTMLPFSLLSISYDDKMPPKIPLAYVDAPVHALSKGSCMHTVPITTIDSDEIFFSKVSEPNK